MLRIGRHGRYRISFSRAFWFQTQVPKTVRRFLFFWVFKEARPSDVDKTKRFPIGTTMDYEGRRYFYWKASRDHDAGEVVFTALPDGEEK